MGAWMFMPPGGYKPTGAGYGNDGPPLWPWMLAALIIGTIIYWAGTTFITPIH